MEKSIKMRILFINISIPMNQLQRLSGDTVTYKMNWSDIDLHGRWGEVLLKLQHAYHKLIMTCVIRVFNSYIYNGKMPIYFVIMSIPNS